MTENAHNGEVEIDLAGTPTLLRYRWAEIGALQTRYGTDWNNVVARHLLQDKVEEIAFILSVGLGGDWTAERVMALSPPLVPVAQAIQRAFRRAYYGIAEEPREAKQDGSADPRIRQSAMSWLWRLTHGAGSDSRPSSSGA